jgi:hypothetical protein
MYSARQMVQFMRPPYRVPAKETIALAATAGTHPLPVALSPSIPLATSSGFLDIEA